MLHVAVTQGRPAAEALRLLTIGCYCPASLDVVLEEAVEECGDGMVAEQLAAARMRYRLHEESVCGLLHWSEEHRGWEGERRQVMHELRSALLQVVACAEA